MKICNWSELEPHNPQGYSQVSAVLLKFDRMLDQTTSDCEAKKKTRET